MQRLLHGANSLVGPGAQAETERTPKSISACAVHAPTGVVLAQLMWVAAGTRDSLPSTDPGLVARCSRRGMSLAVGQLDQDRCHLMKSAVSCGIYFIRRRILRVPSSVSRKSRFERSMRTATMPTHWRLGLKTFEPAFIAGRTNSFRRFDAYERRRSAMHAGEVTSEGRSPASS